MKALLSAVCAMAVLLSCTAEEKAIVPVPFTEVQITGGFWKPRMETELDVTVPFSVRHGEPAVERFRKCADFISGRDSVPPRPHRFISSDLYKVMEGVAYSLMLRKDEALEAWMDSTIALIARCQRPDGYLYISHICGNPTVPEMGEKPYDYVLHSHELYNMGHLYEAATAYWQATGKTELMDVARRSAAHIGKVFFEGDPAYHGGKPVNQAPGHEEIELALCKLYRATGDAYYLELAKKFLDIRGVTLVPDGEGVCSPEYAQQHLPVREQREAVGHCVRAIYLYTGMAQVDALTGLKDYSEALDAIWTNLVSSRIAITGGLGAERGIEGFGEMYRLPNRTAYNETCAAVANVFFNFGMFLSEGDSRYLDIAEVSLFNNALAGISLSGDRFFYVNPLESDGVTDFNAGGLGRAEWFGCACCPPNISRLILQTPGYMYSHTDDEIYVTLYAGNESEIHLKKTDVSLRQVTEYPYDGYVRISVDPSREADFSLKLRIPAWCSAGSFMPGGLYSYSDGYTPSYTLRVNGEEVVTETEKGFASIRRVWRQGDVVELVLDMKERYVTADSRVTEDAGCVAVTRGPIVYCAEDVDNAGPVQALSVDGSAIGSETVCEGILKGQVVLTTSGSYNGGPAEVKMIPYYSWANRGDSTTMKVWLPLSR